MDIYQDKIYDIKVISYMKSLTKDIPINPIGIIKNKTRNALCGNCGYKSHIIK